MTLEISAEFYVTRKKMEMTKLCAMRRTRCKIEFAFTMKSLTQLEAFIISSKSSTRIVSSKRQKKREKKNLLTNYCALTKSYSKKKSEGKKKSAEKKI